MNALFGQLRSQLLIDNFLKHKNKQTIDLWRLLELGVQM